MYQFEPEVQVIKTGSPGEKTGFRGSCSQTSNLVFLKFSYIPQENICVGVFFDKLARLKICNSIKKRLQNKCFPEKFANFLITGFLQNSFIGYF